MGLQVSHCNIAKASAEHILLYYHVLQKHKVPHHLLALEHLWESPEEALAFPRHASIIWRPILHIHLGDARRGGCQLSIRDNIWRRPWATQLLQLQRCSLFLHFALKFMLSYRFEIFTATHIISKNSSVFSFPPFLFSKLQLYRAQLSRHFANDTSYFKSLSNSKSSED